MKSLASYCLLLAYGAHRLEWIFGFEVLEDLDNVGDFKSALYIDIIRLIVFANFVDKSINLTVGDLV